MCLHVIFPAMIAAFTHAGPEDPKIMSAVKQKAGLVFKAYFTQHGLYATAADLELLKCILREHGL